MRLYQLKLFKLRLVKNIYSTCYDIAFIYFLLPKYFWEFLLSTSYAWGWCDNSWGTGMQLVVAIVFALLYKSVDILVHVPFGIY